VSIAGITLSAGGGQLTTQWSATTQQPWAPVYLTPPDPRVHCDSNYVQMNLSLQMSYAALADPVKATLSFTVQSGGTQVSYESADPGILDQIFKDAGAADKVAAALAGNIARALEPIRQFQVPQIGAFAVTNLLFPDQNVVRLAAVRVPADLVAFGTLQASELAVAPAMATVATGQAVTFTASAPVTWAASAGRRRRRRPRSPHLSGDRHGPPARHRRRRGGPRGGWRRHGGAGPLSAALPGPLHLLPAAAGPPYTAWRRGGQIRLSGPGAGYLLPWAAPNLARSR
jgi:hypothetical protein